MTLLRLSGVGVLFLFFYASAGRAQTATPLLHAKDLQDDVAILRHAYEDLHPGLYRYNSKAQMDADFATLGHTLDHDQSLQDAFLAFSEFAAKVRCGHTQANPFNQSKGVSHAIFQGRNRLPFYFQWLNRHMIVTKDFSDTHAFPAGTEIMSVNGVPAERILTRLMTIARADGANDSKRVAQLAVTGDSEYETFDLYYPIFFPTTDSSYKFTIRKPDSRKPRHVIADALTFEQRIAPLKKREDSHQGGSDVLFEARQVGKNSLYLKMPTWALYNSKWDWKSWLHGQMDSAAETNADGLILDLRGNEGGEDVGNEILPYLIDTPMTLSPMRRLVRYRKVPDDLVPYLDTWDKSFRDWGKAAEDLPSPWPTTPQNVPYLKLTRYDEDVQGDVIKPAARRFRGKVILLIDATNSSATFQFAQNVQAHHLGVLIGQPTGGSQRGINGGAFFFLRLPKSGIEMDLPLIGTFPPFPMPDAGITPDIRVDWSAQDIAKGHDPEMATALQLLQKK